jgi:hypothetical protein
VISRDLDFAYQTSTSTRSRQRIHHIPENNDPFDYRQALPLTTNKSYTSRWYPKGRK